jgi:precorrin-3B C17-methyltransferase
MNRENNLLWLFSGTSDGNRIAAEALSRGYRAKFFVASEFGKRVAAETLPCHLIHAGRLSQRDLLERYALEEPAVVLDATHPYAVEISRNLMELCREKGIPYARYERPDEIIPGKGVHLVDDVTAAAECANRLGKRLLLTTGSKNVDPFIALFKGELFIRMLPDPDLIRQLLEKEVSPKNIIAMQGPFSLSLNKAMLADFKIDCLVTKSSGKEGGYPEKIKAAGEMGIPVVVIKRPRMDYPMAFRSAEEVFRFLDDLEGMSAPSPSQIGNKKFS